MTAVTSTQAARADVIAARVIDVAGEDDPVVVPVNGLEEHLLSRLPDGQDDLRALVPVAVGDFREETTAALGALGIEMEWLSPADLDDDTWGVYVWEAIRDGGDWVEGDWSIRLRAQGYESHGHTGKPATGQSRVNPALQPGGWLLIHHKGARVGAELIGDGQTWADVRAALARARSRAGVREAQRVQERLEAAKRHLAAVQAEYGEAVRGALEDGASGPDLGRALGITATRVYQLRDGKR